MVIPSSVSLLYKAELGTLPYGCHYIKGNAILIEYLSNRAIRHLSWVKLIAFPAQTIIPVLSFQVRANPHGYSIMLILFIAVNAARDVFDRYDQHCDYQSCYDISHLISPE